MRIISKFRDYYDTALGYGVDKTVIYNRQTKTYKREDHIEFPNEVHGFKSKVIEFTKSVNKKLNVSNFYVSFEFKILLFCGKIYIYRYDDKLNELYFLDLTKQKNQVKKYTNNKKRKTYLLNELEAFERVLHKFNVDSVYTMSDYSMFHEHKSPIIMEKCPYYGEYALVVVNPCLQNIEFYKLVDAFTAFQEISMFVGGVLSATQHPPVEISDKDMVYKKGFDDKSFRKPPTK